MPISSQMIDQAVVSKAHAPQRLCTHRENGTVNAKWTIYLNIRISGVRCCTPITRRVWVGCSPLTDLIYILLPVSCWEWNRQRNMTLMINLPERKFKWSQSSVTSRASASNYWCMELMIESRWHRWLNQNETKQMSSCAIRQIDYAKRLLRWMLAALILFRLRIRIEWWCFISKIINIHVFSIYISW